MILASAQINSKRGDISANLDVHYKLIEQTAKNKVDLIVFPEMSITGYERENARELAFSEQDKRLDKLEMLAREHNIFIIAGAPVLIKNDLYIGAFIFIPNKKTQLYTKQYLHTGEEVFFKPSMNYNPGLKIGSEKISFAICADINNPLHADAAAKSETTVYVASIFSTPGGVHKEHKILSDYARKHKMAVLMSNFCGHSWGLDAGGQSAFWNQSGKLVATLNKNETGLLVVEKDGNTVERKN